MNKLLPILALLFFSCEDDNKPNLIGSWKVAFFQDQRSETDWEKMGEYEWIMHFLDDSTFYCSDGHGLCDGLSIEKRVFWQVEKDTICYKNKNKLGTPYDGCLFTYNIEKDTLLIRETWKSPHSNNPNYDGDRYKLIKTNE